MYMYARALWMASAVIKAKFCHRIFTPIHLKFAALRENSVRFLLFNLDSPFELNFIHAQTQKNRL